MKTSNGALSLAALLISAWLINTSLPALAATSDHQGDLSHGANNFYRSETLTMHKVTFPNQYKMNVTGNLYLPKDMKAGENAPPLSWATRWAR